MFGLKKNRKKESAADPSRKIRPAYPFLIERRLKGYNTAIAIFLAFGIVSWIISKSFLSMGFGLVLALSMWILAYSQKRSLDKNGFETWDFQVVEMTKLTPLNVKPTGFFADALNGPYAGRLCHIVKTNDMITPGINQKIQLFVPGNTEASLVGNVYYIPQHYGYEFINTEEEKALYPE